MSDIDYAHIRPVASMTDDQINEAYAELPHAVKVYGEKTLADVKRSILMGYRRGQIDGE